MRYLYLFLIILFATPLIADAKLEQLEKKAHELEKTPDTQRAALAIYFELDRLKSDNSDYLFGIGKLLAWLNYWDCAEVYLKRSLKIEPKNSDAAVQLGLLYFWEGRYCLAEKYLKPYPENIDARRGLAKTYLGELKYCAALREYDYLLSHNNKDETIWKEVFETKSHTNDALLFEENFTQSKENDPNLNAPVVKNYYIDSSITGRFPITDKVRLDARGSFYQQIEDDIYPPTGVNYNVVVPKLLLTNKYFFQKDWRWDVSLRALHAQGIGREEFPFQNTTRFEPGTLLFLNSEEQLLVLDAHFESFIIKNFQTGDSELLTIVPLVGRYGYKWPDLRLRPEIEYGAANTFFFDAIHNQLKEEDIILRAQTPGLEDYLTLSYRFEHRAFDRLTTNYFSFHRQVRHTAGVRFYKEFKTFGTFELVYERRYQDTHDLIQQIGNFLFTASRQLLIGNRVATTITYQCLDRVRLELGGYYFHDNLPSTVWNFRGSLLYQF